jgi:hypothetical protein
MASTLRWRTSSSELPFWGGNLFSDVEPVDVDRLTFEPVGDLLSLD